MEIEANLLNCFQVTAMCRNDNPNMFDPFAVEVGLQDCMFLLTDE